MKATLSASRKQLGMCWSCLMRMQCGNISKRAYTVSSEHSRTGRRRNEGRGEEEENEVEEGTGGEEEGEGVEEQWEVVVV